ncbi:hypothetical protein LCGC14_2966080 [marine sediment metagenome]|uniref:Uncharacterized protein n=1 Tax=marine sediment metagenome TaxID=412755 RepID=A0A0F8XBP1_9ZZZZ
MRESISRVLGIVAMLVVALVFSVSAMPRAGPDQEVSVEQTNMVMDLTVDNIGTLSDRFDELRTTEQVFVVAALSVSDRMVVRETNGAAQWMYRNLTASGSPAMHRTDNGWRLLTT